MNKLKAEIESYKEVIKSKNEIIEMYKDRG